MSIGFLFPLGWWGSLVAVSLSLLGGWPGVNRFCFFVAPCALAFVSVGLSQGIMAYRPANPPGLVAPAFGPFLLARLRGGVGGTGQRKGGGVTGGVVTLSKETGNDHCCCPGNKSPPPETTWAFSSVPGLV